MSNQEENASAYPELIDKGISFVDELNYLINHKMENEIDSLKRNMQSGKKTMQVTKRALRVSCVS